MSPSFPLPPSAPALSHPARRLALRSTGLPRRAFRKKAAAQPGRASLAADYFAICELDPTVEALRTAPEPASFTLDDGTIEHVADFEIVREGVATLVDVVTDADLPHHPLRAALIGGAAEAADGRPLVIETAATIRAEPRLTTVRLVMACRRVVVSAGDRVRILHHLDESGTAPLVECAGVVQNAADGVAAVLALAVEGLVTLEIDGPILPETPIRRRRAPAAEAAF